MNSDSFWHFAISCYGRQGIETTCLTLQDDYQLNVMLLLGCLWAGTRQRALTSELLEELDTLVREWDCHVVAPLRAVRRWLKGFPEDEDAGVEAFRLAIRDNELRGEELLARQLEPRLSGDVQRAANADWEITCRGNLAGYARRYNLQDNPRITTLFTVLIRAAGETADL